MIDLNFDFDHLRKVMQNERLCVLRNDYCDHKCAYCDLVMNDDELVDAYDKTIYCITVLQIFSILLDKIKDADSL